MCTSTDMMVVVTSGAPLGAPSIPISCSVHLSEVIALLLASMLCATDLNSNMQPQYVAHVMRCSPMHTLYSVSSLIRPCFSTSLRCTGGGGAEWEGGGRMRGGEQAVLPCSMCHTYLDCVHGRVHTHAEPVLHEVPPPQLQAQGYIALVAGVMQSALQSKFK